MELALALLRIYSDEEVRRRALQFLFPDSLTDMCPVQRKAKARR